MRNPTVATSLVSTVRSYAPGFIFTTALPPAICAAATAAIRHLENGELGARAAPGTGGAGQSDTRRGRFAGHAEHDTHCTASRWRPGEVQGTERSAAVSAWHLHSAY